MLPAEILPVHRYALVAPTNMIACVDVNECDSYFWHTDTVDENSIDDFSCTCNAGFTENWLTKCIDNDECVANIYNYGDNTTSNTNAGGLSCSCNCENIDGASDGSICCIANECFFVAFVTRFKTPLYLIFSTLSRLRLISRIFSEPTEKPKTEAAVNLNEDA